MTTIKIYLDDGRVFEYEASPDKAREHAHAIATNGYRHTKDGTMELYPSWRILKIVAVGEQSTKYPDTVSGT